MCPPLLGRRKREAAPRRRECAHMAPNPLAAPTPPSHWSLAAYPLEGRGSHPVTSPLLTALIKGLYASAFCTPPLQPRLKLIAARPPEFASRRQNDFAQSFAARVGSILSSALSAYSIKTPSSGERVLRLISGHAIMCVELVLSGNAFTPALSASTTKT